MNRFLSAAFVLIVVSLTPCTMPATTIDFDGESAGTGPFLTGIPDSPLTIGVATFEGGELRFAETGLLADQTGVYATQGVFGSDSNPLLIQFSVPVSGFSVFVANGNTTATYTVSDNLGDSVQGALASPAAGGSQVFSLPGSGILSVTVRSINANGWNFAIDDVTFTAATVAPEPEHVGVTALSLIGLAAIRRRRSV